MIRKLVLQTLGFFIALPILVLTLLKLGWRKTWYTKPRPLPPAILTDPKWGKSQFVRLPNILMHYVEKGDKKKPLMLFLHGFPDFWFSWRNQLNYFSSKYWCVAPDMRGFGNTDKPTGIENYDMDSITDDILNLIEHLGKREVIIVGHDKGGPIAYTACEKRPELFKCLIVMNTSNPYAFYDVLETSWNQKLKSWYFLFFQCPILPELIVRSNDFKKLEITFQEQDKDVIEAYKYIFRDKRAFQGPINWYRNSVQKPREASSVSQHLVRVPTLSLFGMKDKYLGTALVDRSKVYAGDEFIDVRIPDVGHFLQQEDPKITNQKIEEYLIERGF